MNVEVFLSLLEEVFEADAGSISADDLLQDISGWDSLTFLGLITKVDEKYGVTLGPAAVLSCETVRDLMVHVQDRCQREAA